MSVTPPAEPPRFVLPGSEPADDQITDPALDPTLDPAAIDPAVPVDQDAEGGAEDGAGPLPVDPDHLHAEDTLEAAIAAALAAPDDAPTVTPVAGNPAPVEGVVAGSEASSLSSDPADLDSPPASTGTPHPTDDLLDLGNGLVVSKTEATELLLWAQSLTPEEQAAVEAVTQPSAPSPYPSAASGSGTPAPVGPPAGAGSFYPAPGQPGMPIQPGANLPPVPVPAPAYTPAPQPLAIREKLGELAEVVPGLAEILEAQQAQVEAQQAEIYRYQQAQASMQAQQAQEQIAAERSRIAEGVRTGDAEFIASHPELSPEDVHYIRTSALESGLMTVQMPKNNNNAAEAYKATLETIMWSDPKYRDLLVQQQAVEVAHRQREVAERRANASALAGNPGSVTRDPQSAPEHLTPEGRQMGMREYIAAAISGGNPS